MANLYYSIFYGGIQVAFKYFENATQGNRFVCTFAALCFLGKPSRACMALLLAN